MATNTTASIIINNYNYGRFLKEAIDSTLRQSYSNIEVIVVDDGSEDNSREVIAGYGDLIIPVLKQNGGQASAFNAGFARSRGDVVFFLDADDMLLDTAVERSLPLFRNPHTVKAHWPLWVIDRDGHKTGDMIPQGNLSEGDLRELVIREGPVSHLSPPTSGNVWARSFLKSVFPIPELEFRLCADTYLFEFAPLFGELRQISEPQGLYRIHGQNHYTSKRFEEMLQEELVWYGHLLPLMAKCCHDMGSVVDVEAWKRNTWYFRLERAMQEIGATVPPGNSFILVDQDQWGMSTASRPPIPFLERDGKYWGNPPDDETAVRELERLRQAGASFIVFGWPAFWWLDDYLGLHHFLRSQFRCVLKTDCVIIFDLRPSPLQGAATEL
jgi:glycosyltransferase involved in cell wall biosynthesis